MVHTRTTSCLLVLSLAVLTRVVTALDCAPQCRCYGNTTDCSHGVLTAFPRIQVIPSSTEILLLNYNRISKVTRSPRLPNLLELNLEDNYITGLTHPSSKFMHNPNLQVLRLGGNAISAVDASAFGGLSQLVRLYLNENTITTITAFGSDSAVGNLKMLDLQGNKLTSIGIGTFTGVSLLTELNLSFNNISTIEDGSFSPLNELRVLYLHSNHIGVLNHATFLGMPALTRLTLGHNKIQTLPDMAFPSSTNLEFLDLSYNNISTVPRTAFSGLYNLISLLLDRNNISSIEDGAFGDLAKLQSLVLRGNSLYNMSASTFTSPDLLELDLAENSLAAVRREDFARLTKLKYLHLHGNVITSVEDGSFANLNNLLVLEIFGNRLTSVSAATFEGLVSVEQIGMGGSSNRIESFPDDTFWHLPKLASLGLLGLPIVSISDAVLSPLQSLKSIALSGSKLRSVPALPVSLESLTIQNNNQMLREIRLGDFTTLPRSGTGNHLPLPNLVTLKLPNSGLQRIHPFAFATLPALRDLDLSRSDFQSISSVDPDAFGNLTTLLTLKIDRVTTWSPRVFRHLPCLQTVTLGTWFTCDCDVLELGKWINQTVVNFEPSPPTCRNPSSLEGRYLETLREEDVGVMGTCPTTTVPPATEPAMQICPTPSPSPTMAPPSQGSSSVATPKSPVSSSTIVGQTGPCVGPSGVTVQNVKDSRVEVKWAHGGNLDLTGFVIRYKPIGANSWNTTQHVHSNSRSYPILDLLQNTPYIACVIVFCNNVKLMEPEVAHCQHFTTGKAAPVSQAAAGGLSQAAVVGLAVGVPLSLIILGLVGIMCLKMRGHSSPNHVDGRAADQPHQQDIGLHRLRQSPLPSPPVVNGGHANPVYTG
ncbi:uncharacterized protein LOC144868500 isoform X2 [Branchiostoma floridae x Branchiostoma japonicum]